MRQKLTEAEPEADERHRTTSNDIERSGDYHGTGANLGLISTQVEALKLINGKGDIITCSSTENPDLFSAARVSLGALGVITDVQMRAEPRYKLSMVQQKAPLEDVVENFESYNRSHRHFEFFWFPYTKTVLRKLTTLSDEPPLPISLSHHITDVVLENVVLGNILFDAISRLASAVPAWAPKISQVCASLISASRRLDWSHRVFATPRWVKFVEMEYAIPVANLRNVIREIEQNLE